MGLLECKLLILTQKRKEAEQLRGYSALEGISSSMHLLKPDPNLPASSLFWVPPPASLPRYPVLPHFLPSWAWLILWLTLWCSGLQWRYCHAVSTGGHFVQWHVHALYSFSVLPGVGYPWIGWVNNGGSTEHLDITKRILIFFPIFNFPK